jgi:hypothetical protein
MDIQCERGQQNTSNLHEILQNNNGKDQERQNQKCTCQRRAQDGGYTESNQKNRLRWFGHVKRMVERRILKRVLELKRGKRPKGRPQTQLVDKVKIGIKRREQS